MSASIGVSHSSLKSCADETTVLPTSALFARTTRCGCGSTRSAPLSNSSATVASRATAASEASITKTTTCAFCAAACVRRMPSASMAPTVRAASSAFSRRPAVSKSSTGSPPNFMATSTTSRVVPASAETMAASRPARALRTEDLPAFGAPARTTRTPSRTASPRTPSRSASRSSPRSMRTRSNTPPSAPVNAVASTSPSVSSPKSTAASAHARQLTSSARQRSYRAACLPPMTDNACLRCCCDSAQSRSARPSTSVTPSFPAWNARRVNSPRSAGRAFVVESASRTPSMVAAPPWTCSSTMSSPVNDFGPSKRSTTASSSASPVLGHLSVRRPA
mmetsp:Transcript_15657/g.52763  ORF Transcript_15657/g.52763 Transcript_15657/m.52763 type:complete len:335 (+) Transcript_15657:361-1365(+)